MIRDLKSMGFKNVHEGDGAQYWALKTWKVRLDPIHLSKNGFKQPHMHIMRGRNSNNRSFYDTYLNQVSKESKAAHIVIQDAN